MATFAIFFQFKWEDVTDPVKIANDFCHYFTNIGPTLASKIQTTNSTFQNFVITISILDQL
jgi:hypothetical protein